MSPTRDVVAANVRGFPRVSGDEPDLIRWFCQPARFSPRERG